MTTQEAVAVLRAAGYSVRAPSARAASSGKRAGRQHRDCVSHHRLAGFSSPVCVVSGQQEQEVLAFAAEVLAIGAGAGDVLRDSRMRKYSRLGEAVAA